jgi:hypothetical protein
VRIEAGDHTERERLARYYARPPLALARLRPLDAKRLIYGSINPSARGRLIVTLLDLIDRIAALIPLPRIHRHR